MLDPWLGNTFKGFRCERNFASQGDRCLLRPDVSVVESSCGESEADGKACFATGTEFWGGCVGPGLLSACCEDGCAAGRLNIPLRASGDKPAC